MGVVVIRFGESYFRTSKYVKKTYLEKPKGQKVKRFTVRALVEAFRVLTQKVCQAMFFTAINHLR